MKSMAIQKVTFSQHHGPYNPGDVAGFDPAKAAELVAAGKARLVEEPKPEPKAAPKSEPKAKAVAEAPNKMAEAAVTK